MDRAWVTELEVCVLRGPRIRLNVEALETKPAKDAGGGSPLSPRTARTAFAATGAGTWKRWFRYCLPKFMDPVGHFSPDPTHGRSEAE